MERIAQEARFRQQVLARASWKGVTAATDQYHIRRKTVWKWSKRYDGTLESLCELSRHPHNGPNAQERSELALVKRYARKFDDDLVLDSREAPCQTTLQVQARKSVQRKALRNWQSCQMLLHKGKQSNDNTEPLNNHSSGWELLTVEKA